MAPSAITPVVLRICAFGVDLKHARCAALGVFANNAGTLRFFGAATGYSELLPKGQSIGAEVAPSYWNYYQ